ncbi:hypothetical protein JL720_13868 [Aureococcus anophagefferens]|nr:hypothetical protein JL720_13868 [Aureococcus anophagefferens]
MVAKQQSYVSRSAWCASVELYGIYYIMGLPVSFLQQRYDTYWDMKFGSSKMYLFRGQMNFLVILVVVLLMPMMLLQRGAMLALMAALGVSSWMLHGTACMLASMVSTSAISALQTGFRTPELLAIVACYYLNIGSTASPASIRVFFILMATLAVSGLVAWTMLVLSPKIQALLADKDRCVDELDMTKAPSSRTRPRRRLEGDEAAAETPADGDDDKPTFDALSGNDMEAIAKQVWPCRVALFWTMFGSIFTAAFFAYANSNSGIDIEQVLYFTRLFGDLFGRPFTSLPRPKCLQTGQQLATFAISRLIFSVIFFVYIFVPGIPSSDLFVIADIGIFSVSSGYLGIISYEYAARDFKKEFDLLNSSFDSPSSVKKLSEEEKWDDTRKMNRLLGYNTPPAKQATSPKEQYMMDWTKLHTSQEMLDYEQRMKKYVRKELQTPYEQDYHDVHKPITGYIAAKTPLHDDINRRNCRVPDETKELSFNTYIPQKRQAMRKILAAKAADAVKALARKGARVSTYAAGGVRATISGGARVPLPPALDGSARPQMETRRFKRTFFALPGNRPEPKRTPELESVGDALKHGKGARTSVAKRLFGRSLARTKPVAPAGSGDLDALGGALVPAARRDDAPTYTPVEAF